MKVLLATGNHDLDQELQAALSDAGIIVTGPVYYREALKLETVLDGVEAVVISPALSGSTSLNEVIFLLRKNDMRVILLAGEGSDELREAAIGMGVYDIIDDPVQAADVVESVLHPATFASAVGCKPPDAPEVPERQAKETRASGSIAGERLSQAGAAVRQAIERLKSKGRDSPADCPPDSHAAPARAGPGLDDLVKQSVDTDGLAAEAAGSDPEPAAKKADHDRAARFGRLGILEPATKRTGPGRHTFPGMEKGVDDGSGSVEPLIPVKSEKEIPARHQRSQTCPCLIFSAPRRGCGATTMAIAAGRALLCRFEAVILIDCDFKSPALGMRFGLPVRDSESDWRVNGLQAMRQIDGLYVLPLDLTRRGRDDIAPLLEQIRTFIPGGAIVIDAGQEPNAVPGVRIGVITGNNLDSHVRTHDYLILNKTKQGGETKNVLGVVPYLSMAEIDLRMKSIIDGKGGVLFDHTRN